ncbi:hypothetical protein GLOIN_2v1843403 [Rhizophagus clarus]|uniref:Uncharacterized protein n=1 Tax=Rhizophagus clarus TaxID=94130 RepID=A0A8H3L903_9GLOM|nr:hypothetical protein GLOIN_2v1843403 [Rhizophagus clarus]
MLVCLEDYKVAQNYETGKITVIWQCARNIRKEVIYIDVSPILDNFVNNLSKFIRFKEYISIIELLMWKIFGSSVSDKPSRFSHILDAFKRGALKYKVKNSKPSVLILDNIDPTSKETFNYLHSKLGIEKKVTNQLIQLLGSQIHDLKEYGNMINGGETFEDDRAFTIWIMIMCYQSQLSLGLNDEG